MLPVRRYIFFQLDFCSAGQLRSLHSELLARDEDWLTSEQRRLLNRRVNRVTKILSEAGKHKKQQKKKGSDWPLISPLRSPTSFLGEQTFSSRTTNLRQLWVSIGLRM